MGEQIGRGIGWVLFGGFLSSSFALPMKRMPGWRWENTWLAYCLVGMVVLPWAFAASTIPQLPMVYHRASWPVLLRVGLFGAGWGIGSILFGLGIRVIGVALGFAIIQGVAGSVGALLPLAILHPEKLLSRQGAAIIAGTLLVTLGVVLCAIAGLRRERGAPAPVEATHGSKSGVGLLICIFSGIFSAMLNFSFVFGGELQVLSRSAGASEAMSANAIWSLALGTGFLVNASYCVYLLCRNASWLLFLPPKVRSGYWMGASLMGLIWFSGIASYGIGAAALGDLGGIVGWPILMATVILGASFWGTVTGEWAGASRSSRVYAWTGVAVLLLAIYVISQAKEV